MTFLWPAMLYSLMALPLFIALYLLLQRRRKRIAANYRTLSTAPEIAKREPGLRGHIPPILFLLALAMLGLALARPQTEVSLPHVEGTVILAFDISGSMAADDLKPTRMEAAKAAAKSFVEHQPSTVRIGVVAFSDNGLSVQAPTSDQDAILTAIDRLAPQRGTSLAGGIAAALKAIEVGAGQPSETYTSLTPVPTLTPTPVPPGTYGAADIVLLTDGENNENPDPLAAAQTAAQRGVRIYSVGIGSAAGTNLHINGFTVHTQLDENMLKQISQITGGTYFNAQSEQELLKIYDNLNPQLVVTPEVTEVTSIFAGGAILLMLVGGMFSLLWFSRLP
ncbi:MAG TPA: VWA domain-containing protein [Anaerolineales bacterium]|nr:VWA domain-containing protein [Anaerolineales bacterium]